MHSASAQVAAGLFVIGLAFMATKRMKNVAYVFFGAGAVMLWAGASA